MDYIECETIFRFYYGCSVHFFPGVLDKLDLEWDSAVNLRELIDAKPAPGVNPYNANQSLLRSQGFFAAHGTVYRFSGQTPANLGTISEAPAIVRHFLAWANSQHVEEAPYTAVHVNWYPNGKAGLRGHQDEDVDPRFPIYSLTVMPEGGLRCFVVAKDKELKQKLLEVPLQHGNVITMEGDSFQRTLWHGVPPTTRKETKNQMRINLTVRAWGSRRTITAEKGSEPPAKRTRAARA